MDSDNTRPENPVDNPPGLPKKGSENWDLSSDSELSSPPSSDESNNEMNANKKPAEKAMKAQKDIALKKVLKNLNKNVSVLRQHLKLTSDEEWKTWLQSLNFLPYWEELWTCWLSKQKKQYRGPGIEHVLSVMRTEAENFDEKHVDKDGWDDIHHYAYFMHQILRRNLNHTDGLFRFRPMGPNEAEYYLWAAMKCVQHKFAPSQRHRPSGGHALLYGETRKRKGHPSQSTPRKSSKQSKKGSTQNPISGDLAFNPSDPSVTPADGPGSSSGLHVNPGSDDNEIDPLSADVKEITDLINVTLADSWKKMIRSYAREKYPVKRSKEFNLSDPYWRLMFARTALHRAELDSRDETQIPQPPETENGDTDHSNDESAGLDPSEAVWGGTVTDAPIFELADLNSEKNHGETIHISNSLDYLEFEDIAAEQEDGGEEDISPNYLLNVSEKSLANYQKELMWLNNPSFQPVDFDKAHGALYLTAAEKDDDTLVRTRHKYMRPNLNLEIWQVLGVARLIEIMEKTRPDGSPLFCGGILSDVMGLGKTFQATVFMLELSHRSKVHQTAWESLKEANPSECGPEPTHRPFLLVVPSAILTQWINEIHTITKHLQVHVLYGNPKSIKDGTFKKAKLIKDPLTLSHELFDGSFSRSNHVIVTSYDTFRSRHGPPAYKKWANQEKARRKKEGDSFVARPWPGDLNGLFRYVILDEAHTLRNADSGLSIAIQWLKAGFYLLLSATIFYNGILDFQGYMSLIIPEQSDAIWEDTPALQSLGVTKATNPFSLPEEHPASFLRFTTHALKKYVFTDNITVQVASVYLKGILKELNVRRTLSSSVQIGSDRLIIGSRIPPSQTRVIYVKFSRNEKAMYDRAVVPHYKKLIMKRNGKVVVNMAKYRMLTLLTSWFGMEFAEELLTVRMFKNILYLFDLNTVCQSLARVVYSRNSPASPSKWFRRTRRLGKVTQPSVNALRTLLRGSPKMRAMLPIVMHNSLIRQEKQIIWCSFQATQVYVAAVLKECGIDARIFHSKLDQSQRRALIAEFTTTDECSILVMSLAVNAVGLNLHPRCSTMHFFDLPPTKSVMDQAIGRLRRFGQNCVVVAYVYSVTNSWNSIQQSKSDEKAVTSMLCDLNPAMFKLAVESSEEISISNLVVRNGALHQLGPGETPLPSDNTSDEDIIAAIQKSFVEEVGAMDASET